MIECYFTQMTFLLSPSWVGVTSKSGPSVYPPPLSRRTTRSWCWPWRVYAALKSAAWCCTQWTAPWSSSSWKRWENQGSQGRLVVYQSTDVLYCYKSDLMCRKSCPAKMHNAPPPPVNKVQGVNRNHPVCPSVCLCRFVSVLWHWLTIFDTWVYHL